MQIMHNKSKNCAFIMRVSSLIPVLLLIFPLLVMADKRSIVDKEESCVGSVVFRASEYAAYNAIWGANGDRYNFKQCIGMRGHDERRGIYASYGWNFSLPSRSIKSYPHVTFGWDWDGIYTSPRMPQLVRDKTPIYIKYSTESSCSGRYNVSFDIWASRVVRPQRGDLTREIMIWMKSCGVHQTKPVLARVNVGGKFYKLHVGKVPKDVGSWDYIAFVAEEAMEQGEIDISKFMSLLLSLKLLSEDEYINGISFGAEIAEGAGGFQVKGFRASIGRPN